MGFLGDSAGKESACQCRRHETTSLMLQSLDWEDPMEKEMATHSSILAWRIPWMEESGGLQSRGSQRVRHDWSTSLTLSHASKVMRNILKPGFSNMWTVNFQMFKLVLEKTEVDETGAYYTEWTKPERKTPIQYTNTYMWNLERW